MIDRDVTRVQNTYVTNCCWYLTILDVALLNDLSGGDNLFFFFCPFPTLKHLDIVVIAKL
jgi:hypothetical protein